MSRRMPRVSGLIKSEIARLLARERMFEDLIVTVTEVNVSPDLRDAYVYVSSIGEGISPDELLSALQRNAADWQQDIAKRVHIKYTPRLSFRYDDSMVRGDRIMEILQELGDEDQGENPEADPKIPDRDS